MSVRNYGNTAAGWAASGAVMPAGTVCVESDTGKQKISDGATAWASLPYLPAARPINAQTGTAYTLTLADAGGLVTLANGGAITLTVPTNASVAFPIAAEVELAQLGAGVVTVTAAGGVTLNSLSSHVATGGQYAKATLKKTGTDVWLLSGNLA